MPTTRHQQHQAADRQDLARVAGHDAVVDDVGHQAREIQAGERLGQREDEDERDRGPVGPQVGEQLEHGGNDSMPFAARNCQRLEAEVQARLDAPGA